jgi:anti-anti-sigma factor
MASADGRAALARWDGHVLLLHATEAERRTALAAWVQRGLDLGQKIIYTEAPTTSKDALPAVLEASGVDGGAAMRDGFLEVLPLAEFYPPEGQQAVVERALADGFRSVRMSAEARAALSVLSPADYLGFERRMDLLVRSRPVDAMCQYPQADTTGPWLDETVAVHLGGVRQALFSTGADGQGLAVSGEVDATNREVFTVVLAEACRNTDRVLWLDLAGLSYLDASSCWCLEECTRALRADGGHVLLVAPQPSVERVLRLLGLHELPGLSLMGATT